MVSHGHIPIFLSITVFLLETGLVKLAEVGYGRPMQPNFEIPKVLSKPAAIDDSDFSSRQKRLGISSFKTENRKAERNEELVIKSNTIAPKFKRYSDSEVKDSFETALYRVKAADDTTCIKLKVDAILSFKYIINDLDEIQGKERYIPTGATVQGDCSDEDKQNLVLRWQSFALKWYFSKTPDGERWFVPKIELKYDPSDRYFEKIERYPYTMSSRFSHNYYPNNLFQTPMGKSYKCDQEIEVQLSTPELYKFASLLLRDIKVQPFIFKTDEFGPEYMCEATATGSGRYQSETTPLIFGSMLVGACLLTIAGYAIYRKFNIEKVQNATEMKDNEKNECSEFASSSNAQLN